MFASRSLVLAVAWCLFLVGCRGCDEAPASDRGPTRSSESVLERMRARLATRRIDPSAQYAKLPDGAAACAQDLDCFVAHADRCGPAVLEHTHREIGIGVAQSVRSRFRIAGPEGESCRVLRTVFSTEVEMAPAMRAALIKRGQTADEVDANNEKLAEKLRSNNPPRQRCIFPLDRMLELALDLAETKYSQTHFASYCSPVSEHDTWQDQEIAAQPPPVSPTEPVAVPAEKKAP